VYGVLVLTAGSSPGRAWLPDHSPFDLPFADLPSEIARLFATGICPDRGQPIPEGQRNVVLTSLIGQWLAAGHSEAAVLTQALEANRLRCQPPLGIREVERIVQSIAGREAQTDLGDIE